MNLYVASSWRNPRQPEIVEQLRAVGHTVYDFRNPAPGNTGFAWSSIDTDWQSWDGASFRDALEHPVSLGGFGHDHAAMEAADACVLVLPCGRSAHLEAGWFCGRGRPVLVLWAPEQEPELMYRLSPVPAEVARFADPERGLGARNPVCLSVAEVAHRLALIEKAAPVVTYQENQIRLAWADYGSERTWRNQHFKKPYDHVDYSGGELPPGWVWRGARNSYAAAVPRWVHLAADVFSEDECLRNDPDAPTVHSEWLKRFGEEHPGRQDALTFYDGGDWLAYLFDKGRIDAGGPSGGQILIVPPETGLCKLRHPDGSADLGPASEAGSCDCSEPTDCPWGAVR